MRLLRSILEKPAQAWAGVLEWRKSREQPPQFLLLLPLLVGVLVLLVAIFQNWSALTVSEVPADAPPETSLFKHKAGILLGILSYAVGLMVLTGIPILMYFMLLGFDSVPIHVVALFCLGLAALVLVKDIHGNWEGARGSFLGEQSIFGTYLLKLVLVTALLLSPPFLLWLHRRSGILVRYTTRSVLFPFVLCTLGITTIWLIFDLADNLPDFKEDGTPFPIILRFYAVLVPKMIIEVLPVSLLLALLYSLGKLSQSNEVISMLGAGRRLRSVLAPCFVIGLYSSFLCFVLSYHWAPKAEGMQRSMIEAIREGGRQSTSSKEKEEEREARRRGSDVPSLATRQLYRNRQDRRVWYIGTLPFQLSNENKMQFVWIVQEDENGQRQKAWYAKNANWIRNHEEPEKSVWRLFKARVVTDPATLAAVPDVPEIEDYLEEPNHKVNLEGFRETPWMIFSATFDPEFLSVPELASYLRTNHALPEAELAPFRSWLHFRLANPWKAFVLTLVAAPLGIVYSRRGVLGSVAAAIAIFVGIHFFEELFLALARGHRINPFVASWITNLFFLGVGLLLLWLRGRNRELPAPTLANLRKLFRDPVRT